MVQEVILFALSHAQELTGDGLKHTHLFSLSDNWFSPSFFG